MLAPFEKPIYVTQPFLPSLEEFKEGLREIWQSRWLTNNGPIVQRFAEKLADYLGTKNLSLFNNGTLALQIGLQALGVSGEVITTPFTFVATTHALYWNKIRPVFVDIEDKFYTIDPEKVQAAITPWTTAILAVHVYGYPCRHQELEQIAKKYRLRLIYDAAHAFGVKVNGSSIAHWGDMSMFSFHATKLFHSIEGGLLTFAEAGLKSVVNYLRNFGFKNEVEVVMPGTNAKMNEFQALMGEMVLAHMPEIISKRRKIDTIYREMLVDVPGIRFAPKLPDEVEYNFAYVPVEIDRQEFGLSRDQLYEQLKSYNVFTRRYFYPLLCDYSCYRSVSVSDPLTVARGVADRILTLPIYSELAPEDVERICKIIQHLHLKHYKPSTVKVGR